MAVPKFFEFFNVFLESLQDGEVHSYSECREYVKKRMNPTEEDLQETIPSGYGRWMNRVHWCKTHLKKAGVITSPQRAHFQITNEGKALLDEHVKITQKVLLERFPSYVEFAKGSKSASQLQSITEDLIANEETPQETLDRVYQEITSELAEELLTAVMSSSWVFFERLVVRLMEGMGYGGYDGAGFVTKSSGDNGIDGIIHEDKLGFNLIYIQAKRWAIDKIIGKPEIQKFVGALAGPPKIEKGLFITTAKFSSGAKEYADAQHIILVDGKKLTELMIEFDIGVSTQKAYKIKRVDNDFFAED